MLYGRVIGRLDVQPLGTVTTKRDSRRNIPEAGAFAG